MGKRRRVSTSYSSDSSSEDEARILRKKIRKLKRKYGDLRRGHRVSDSDKENGEAGSNDSSRHSSLEPVDDSQSLSQVFLPVEDGELAHVHNMRYYYLV